MMNLDEFEKIEAEGLRQYESAHEALDAMIPQDLFLWAFNKGAHFGITLCQPNAALAQDEADTKLAKRYFEERIRPTLTGLWPEGVEHLRTRYVQGVLKSPAARRQVRETYGKLSGEANTPT